MSVVTGGAGYIGSNSVQGLNTRSITDNLSTIVAAHNGF